MRVAIGELKRELRRNVAARIRALGADERAGLDLAICGVVENLPEYRASAQVLAYWALPDEVSLEHLLYSASKSGKRVFLPKLVGESLEFRRWRPADRLTSGRLGAMEPSNTELPAEVAGIILVPGRAFDQTGWRLGRGYGCYDRSLPSMARLGIVMGVGYGCQILGEIPHDALDVRVDNVVCERGRIECRHDR